MRDTFVDMVIEVSNFFWAIGNVFFSFRNKDSGFDVVVELVVDGSGSNIIGNDLPLFGKHVTVETWIRIWWVLHDLLFQFTGNPMFLVNSSCHLLMDGSVLRRRVMTGVRLSTVLDGLFVRLSI